MPRKDWTGPEWKGPMTGRQRWDCRKKDQEKTLERWFGFNRPKGRWNWCGRNRWFWQNRMRD